MTILQSIKFFTVVANAAKQSSASLAALDCRVAGAPRNDVTGKNA
tara:strand:- start:1048 stop:1182 length:135 start_codon:yes stop_codon:yes gene_type:complete